MLKKFGFILCLSIISNSLNIIFNSYSGQKEIQFNKNKKYFIFENKNEKGIETESSHNNATIKEYFSDDDIEEINSTVFYKSYPYVSSKQNYRFKFASNLNGKYLKFGYGGNSQFSNIVNFSIYENDNIIYKYVRTVINEGYITIKNDYSYIINLTFSAMELDFYLELTEHPNILLVQKRYKRLSNIS